MTREDRNALITGQRCAQAITAVVNDAPTGCPERRLYEPLREFIHRGFQPDNLSF